MSQGVLHATLRNDQSYPRNPYTVRRGGQSVLNIWLLLPSCPSYPCWISSPDPQSLFWLVSWQGTQGHWPRTRLVPSTADRDLQSGLAASLELKQCSHAFLYCPPCHFSHPKAQVQGNKRHQLLDSILILATLCGAHPGSAFGHKVGCPVSLFLPTLHITFKVPAVSQGHGR